MVYLGVVGILAVAAVGETPVAAAVEVSCGAPCRAMPGPKAKIHVVETSGTVHSAVACVP